MKNTLAENMLRFGVKNLSESDIKKIEESLLTEGEIDLKTMPQVAAATKFFKDAWIKNVPKPNYVLGEYYLKSYDARKPGDYRYAGKVIGFKFANYNGVIIPVPDTTIGGYWAFEGDVTTGDKFQFSTLNWDTRRLEIDPRIKPAAAAASINDFFSEIPLRDLQTMYNAAKLKSKFDTNIAYFKSAASPTQDAMAIQIKPLLKGNAKAFFGV
jgi:hypothetical protein